MVRVLGVKAALTVVLLFIVTWQVATIPEHAPDHPVKVELVFAAAVRVTTVPAVKLVPVGLTAMVPEPVPVEEALNVYVVTVAVKVADILWAAVTLLKV